MTARRSWARTQGPGKSRTSATRAGLHRQGSAQATKMMVRIQMMEIARTTDQNNRTLKSKGLTVPVLVSEEQLESRLNNPGLQRAVCHPEPG